MNPYSFNVELSNSKAGRNAQEAGRDLLPLEARNVPSSKINPLLCLVSRIWKNMSSPKVIAAAAVGILAFLCGKHLMKKAIKRLRKKERTNYQSSEVVNVSKLGKSVKECAHVSKDLEERSKRNIGGPTRCAPRDAKGDRCYDPFLTKDLVSLLRQRSTSFKLKDSCREQLGVVGPEKPIEVAGRAQAKDKDVAKPNITFEKGVQTECDDSIEKRRNRKKHTAPRSMKSLVSPSHDAEVPCNGQNRKAGHDEVPQMFQIDASDPLSWIFNPKKAPPEDFEFTVTFKSLGSDGTPFITFNHIKPND